MKSLPLAGGLVLVLATAATALADEVDPNFLSTLRAVDPEQKGLEVEVLNRGDEFEVHNETGKTLLVKGYSGEPYLRFLSDGRVLENQRSPATYLNQDRFATKPVPKSAKAGAKPVWKQVADNGTYEWHDHRIHYMGEGTPRQVEDESKRQKVYDWQVDMRLGEQPVAATGTLLWIPTAAAPTASGDDGGGVPWGILAAALAALAVAIAAVLALRRRKPLPADGVAEQKTPRRSEKESW